MLALLFALACLAPGPSPEALVVSAAISLTDALEEAARAYRDAGGGEVTFNFAASNALARQIVNGARVDVFISADEAQMDALARAGLLAAGTRRPLVRNRLAVIAGRRAGMLTSVRDLTGPAVRRVAIGDPAAVPAGVYAKAYLERAGLWAALQGRLVPAASARAAVRAVERGAADAGIVYASDAAVSRGVRIAQVISGADSPSIVYPGAVVKTSRRAEAGRRFLEFLAGPPAQEIFERHGLVPLSGGS